MDTSSKYIIEVENVVKTFKVGVQDVQVLRDVNFKIETDDFLIIIGPSGSGKSTILHTLLGLEAPTSGTITFMGENIYEEGKNEDYRSDFRKKHIGMVYQQPNWVKSLSVRENIAFPMLLLGMDKTLAFNKAMELLEKVELADWAEYKPTELSSGQQQRIALTRALINDPQIIIADEPTGNLDYENGQRIMQLFKKLNDEEHRTVIMVTHDLEYLHFAKTAVRVFDGTVAGIYKGEEKDKLLHDIKFKRVTNTDDDNQVNDPVSAAEVKT